MRPATFKAICLIDPNFDTEKLTADAMIEHIKSRDFAIVDGKWVDGKRPTIFHVQEVPHHLWESYVEQGVNEAEKCSNAFRAGVFLVENLVGDDDVALTKWEPQSKSKHGVRVPMTAEESARFSPADRLEIGAVVYQHSFLARRIAVTFQLPSSVHERLVSRRFLHVEPSQTTPEATSSEPQSATSEAPTAVTEIPTGAAAAVSG